MNVRATNFRRSGRRPTGALSDLLASPALARLVEAFAARPADAPHVRELLRATGLGSRSLQAELARLERCGVLRRESDGRVVRHRLVADAPAWRALRDLARACAEPPVRNRAGQAPEARDAVPVARETRDHAWLDERRRQLSVAVAEHVRRDPSHIVRALVRVQTRLADGPGPARWALEQWRALLEAARHTDDGRGALLAVLTDRSEYAARLRQSSPFAGVLPQEEREAILARTRDGAHRVTDTDVA